MFPRTRKRSCAWRKRKLLRAGYFTGAGQQVAFVLILKNDHLLYQSTDFRLGIVLLLLRVGSCHTEAESRGLPAPLNVHFQTCPDCIGWTTIARIHRGRRKSRLPAGAALPARLPGATVPGVLAGAGPEQRFRNAIFSPVSCTHALPWGSCCGHWMLGVCGLSQSAPTAAATDWPCLGGTQAGGAGMHSHALMVATRFLDFQAK